MTKEGYQAQKESYLAMFDPVLQAYCSRLPPYAQLNTAMCYSLLAGGKRLRPLLTLGSCTLFGGKAEEALPFALAVELVHCYSLIHDDLPAMDNDDLRRGKPSCHKEFDEATAILAGDALLTSAFVQVASAPLSAEKIVSATLCLSSFAGERGMVGGQALDLISQNRRLELAEVEQIQRLKTGALLLASCHLGAIVAGASKEEILRITDFATKLGRAFQIRDDILDATGHISKLGKPIGSDQKQNKDNFFTLLGKEKAQAQVETLTKEAKEALGGMPKAEFMLSLAESLTERET